MPIARPAFQRFARALHRRHVALRLLERTGLGLLAGSAAGLLLLPLLLWADRPAVPMVAAAMALGGLAGLLWGIARPPTRLASAMQADRQLGLNDLLATALAMAGRPDDPWAAAVVATANARCAALSPGSILLKRLDARVWGGIGLSAATVLALALFFGSPIDSSAAANAPAASAIESPAPEPQSDPGDRPLVALAPAPPSAPPEHDDPNAGQSIGQSTPAPQPASPNPAGPTPANDDARKGSNSASPGTGSGSSQTDKKPAAPPPPHPQAGPHQPENAPPPHDAAAKPAVPSAGPGSAEASRAPGVTHSGGASTVTARAPRPRVTEPWKTDAWPADVQRAHEAIDAGQVAPAYQELVRRYFERQ